MSNDVAEEIRSVAPTNIMLLDTTTLISILVMVVFIIKLFNNVLKTNSVGSLPTVGRSQVQKRSAKFHHNYNRKTPPPSSHFSRRIFIPHNNRQPSRYKNLLWRFLRFRTWYQMDVQIFSLPIAKNFPQKCAFAQCFL